MEKGGWQFVVPGEPVPYLRMTQAQMKVLKVPLRLLTVDRMRLRGRIVRYFRYKEFALLCALDQKFPRAPGAKVFFNVVVYFPHRRHADPENVRKGLQDALYEQDRYVAGSVDFHYDADNPRCEVTVGNLPLVGVPAGPVKRCSFTVPGEPVPYLRMTQAQVNLMRRPERSLTPSQLKLRARISRYFNYKELAALCAAGQRYERAPRSKVFFNVHVYYGKRNHADPENIRKGLQDALYSQDRYVAGTVDFSYDQDNPRCEVEIIEPL